MGGGCSFEMTNSRNGVTCCYITVEREKTGSNVYYGVTLSMTIYISQQFLFRFEVDTLEIVLQELVGVVDTFFLIES